MKYVIGIDLGISAVKNLIVNYNGHVVQEVSKPRKNRYSDPQAWVDQTVSRLSDLLKDFKGNPEDIEGIIFEKNKRHKCTGYHPLSIYV
jgi:xylulokinase